MAISFCKESQDHLIPLCLCVLATNFFLGGCQSTTARPVDPVSQDAKISGRMAENAAVEDLVAPEPPIDFKSIADAELAIKNLGPQPTSSKLAATLAEFEDWSIEPQQEEAFRQLQLRSLDSLRRKVKAEVEGHQDAALRSPRSIDGASELEEAGRVLALYPLSDDRRVVDEATRLMKRQTNVGARLAVLQRQRYNRWALEQIEAALNYYTEKKNFFRSGNEKLIGPLSSRLAPIDPILLEPVVLDLYSYVLSQIKSSLPTDKMLAFAKQLTAPSNQRKTLGDY